MKNFMGLSLYPSAVTILKNFWDLSYYVYMSQVIWEYKMWYFEGA
jgi:hypothetical protein